MHTTAYIELGVIQRKQGLRGNVVAWLNHDVAHLDSLKTKTLFVQINHTLVPYCIEQYSYQHREAILKLQGIDSPEAAHYLRGCSIFVHQEASPRTLTQESDSLLGYHVVDVQEGRLGTVQAIYAPVQQRLLTVNYQGRELFIPYHEDIVTHVSHEQQIITVQLPSGFIKAMY